jgi:nitrite reductase/ring-hydroxylating ferredoxin subunit/uncharacterized glyoxalase superfamily protein PhnB
LTSASPLAAAILGVESLDRSTAFYRDVVGLDAGPEVLLEGADFEAHWGLPRGARARSRCLIAAGCEMGAVTLIEFEAMPPRERRRVRRDGEATVLGLWNLNFYVEDIRAVCRDLAAAGHVLWSAATSHEVGTTEGAPVEALFDGPDGVAINLVELTGGDDTVIGRMRAAVRALGHTRTGWTAVATTSHSVRDADAAARFYREVLGHNVLMDAVLDKPASNHFLRRPEGAKTRALFMTAGHAFGKIALSQPLNYAVPDRVAAAVAPNVGYLAQSFDVADLDRALQLAVGVGAEIASSPVTVDARGIGSAERAALLRCPGSAALIQLVADDSGAGSWISAGSLRDFDGGRAIGTTLAGHPVAVFRVQGELYATDRMCTHAFVPLERGRLDGFEIECPVHLARFDLRNGACRAVPAPYGIRTFRVRLRGDVVEVWIARDLEHVRPFRAPRRQ